MNFIYAAAGSLFRTLAQGLKHAVDRVLAALECRDNVLGGRLEEGNNVGDEFVLALECGKCFELIGSLEAFLYVSAFEFNFFVLITLDELCRYVARVTEHDSRRAFESLSDGLEVDAFVGEGFLEQVVLHHHQLNLLVEASTTQC